MQTNYRCPEGEVDIVARDKDCLVFVEVRAKRSSAFGSPEESITAAKRDKLRRVVAHYRQAHEDIPDSWRIDVVAVEMDRQNRPRRIELCILVDRGGRELPIQPDYVGLAVEVGDDDQVVVRVPELDDELSVTLVPAGTAE